ncbi:MAG: deoxyguanosinetriphosphate triphosphohydrolase [Rhizobiales bacterium 24-66-13]|jgi:dGTPase|uniref:deoxyguanosinetriphosphate triphosphohydrolase n=1 Tax=Roseixanthobacter finlandensis TaxID=3119922 RepID=UPI000BC737D7|nr:MAG: deoxyguanosinetriphosphate triphosphohydrolase [Rhizobiales bacterium 24-66-13]OZA93876.1 MAG: deoxyguanosinetriphosphate triphosphohydrolase [Rhizobiales bacterium 39-66-18]HQS09245.1 deoxyguanosinetriphosphate triphosphohydrolase [Xanthobacteraceae bacterium]HQS47939.1 deoxyguanosinetriphosphate triphosphohydrolase [Xanthobacteraceae bacterium]
MAVLGSTPRVSYASDPLRSRGRLHPEPEGSRNVFRRDCDRVIHSTAFRRLKHKTQVFVFHEGDHFRTRLTHTLEVVQVARSIARALGLDEDLAEVLGLAHDLGHPPFAHAGERALDVCLQAHGGFDHNAQSLRMVTRLERRYAAFDGLNLTWETLEGIIKHNGPMTDRQGRGIGRYAAGLPHAVTVHSAAQDLELWSHAGPEAQAAALADDIAYDVHDIDDGLRAGLFALEDLAGLPLVGDALAEVRALWPALDKNRTAYEMMRRVITRFIEDVVCETDRRAAAAGVASVEEVRALGRPLVGFSAEVQAAEAAIKGFLFPRMYRHERVNRIMADAAQVVRDLFAHFLSAPDDMPPDWRRDIDPSDTPRLIRRVADYIAGMTDRYALDQHARYFDSTPDLR